jgi:uncharacterized delta-60 repeat protein
VQADGKILVGGDFTTIGGQTRNRIARLNADGTADSFDPDANGQVYAIAVQADGKILAGGAFTSIGGQTRNFIARLDATTGAADSFNPNANNLVRSIAVQADGKILAGGEFFGANSIGGQTRNFIARLDATTGAADSFDPNANATVYAMVVQADGKILAGGLFSGANSIGGQARNLFARLSNDTAALQNLAVTQTTVTWTRGGSSPQFTRVTFEYSTDNVNYTSLGNGTAAGSNWTLTGLSLSTGQNFYIRARGYYRSGYVNGSESITESVRNAFIAGPTGTPTPTATPTAAPTATATATPIATPTPTPIPPVITSPLAESAIVGQPFVYQFEATGATSLAVSDPPPGLTFDANLRAIVGTPSAAGIFQVGLSATNAGGTTNATLTITVQPPASSGPTIMSGSAATGRTGQFFSFHVITTGGSPSARLSVSGLPPELAVDPVAGLISGTVTSDGSFAVTLTVTNGSLTTTSTLQLTFTSDPAVPVIISPDRAALTRGEFFSYTINAPSSADPSTDPTIFTYIGTDGILHQGPSCAGLPAGLCFDGIGTISGIYAPPLQASAKGGPRKPELAGGALLGSIQLFATNSHGTSTLPLLFLPAPSGAVNIATRLSVGTSENVLIGGFIITGNAPKVVLIRALGPSTGVPGALQDPTLELHDGANPDHVVFNDNWRDSQQDLIIGATIPPTDDRESAIVIGLDPGAYTAIVAGKNGATGIALVEVYDLGTGSLDASGNAKLANIATRGFVDTGNNVMIGGFIIRPQAPATSTRVLIRAIGPSLTAFGIAGALQDPTLELHDGNGTLMSNDDWQSSQRTEIEATGLAPTDIRESAIVATLPTGLYTAIVSGKDNTTGVAVVEAYVLE